MPSIILSDLVLSDRAFPCLNLKGVVDFLWFQVKRLESLLAKCQETMKSNKEKIQLLTTDREDMSQQLEMKSDELDKFKVIERSSLVSCYYVQQVKVIVHTYVHVDGHI